MADLAESSLKRAEHFQSCRWGYCFIENILVESVVSEDVNGISFEVFTAISLFPRTDSA